MDAKWRLKSRPTQVAGRKSLIVSSPLVSVGDFTLDLQQISINYQY